MTKASHELPLTSEPSKVLMEYLDPLELDIQAYDVDKALLHEYGFDTLPEGVAVIGGAARAVALETLTGESAPVRDIDLVVLSEMQPSLTPDDIDRLSSHYMPDDTAHGHGMRTEQSIANYFRTRDFSMNEVLLVGTTLLLTKDAEQALREKRIAPTDYEMISYGAGRLGPKLSMKALLMKSVFEIWYGTAHLDARLTMNGGLFYIALALNKALQYDQDVARRFMWELAGYDQIPEEYRDDPVGFARMLESQTDFVFSPDMLDSGETPSDERLWSLLGRLAGRMTQYAADEFGG